MGEAAPRGAVEMQKALWVMRNEASGPRGAGGEASGYCDDLSEG